MTDNLDSSTRKEIYPGDSGEILCIDYQRSSFIYVDSARIIIGPMSAVERLDLTHGGWGMLKKFVYKSQGSREAWLSHCDENVRCLVESFRNEMITFSKRQRQAKKN